MVAADVLRTSGEPLPVRARAVMEPRFGTSFADVRIHTDASAATAARAIGARAFTAGHHIVFGAGRDRLDSEEGQSLLAHELTHVLQQSAAAIPRDVRIAPGRDAHEREAERAAKASGAARIPVSTHVTVPIIQRDRLANVTFIKEEDLPPQPGPPQKPNLPALESEKQSVELVDHDKNNTRFLPFSDVRQSSEYVDNQISKVYAKGNIWTLEIELLLFDYLTKPRVTIPFAMIDPTYRPRAEHFVKQNGVIYPLNDDDSLAFDSANTPNIVIGRRIWLEEIAKAATDRIVYARVTLGFQIALAQLGAAVAVKLPEGRFGGGVLRIGNWRSAGVGGGAAVDASEALLTLSDETVGEFSIHGSKALVGKSFQRRILILEYRGAGGAGSGTMAAAQDLVQRFEAEARLAGASELRILGMQVERANFFRVPRLWEKLGFSFEKLGESSFEVVKKL